MSPDGTTGSSEMRSTRGRRTLQPWLTAPLMFLGLLFVVLPIALAVEDAAWALYGFGLFWAVVIALLARRWYRVTVIERGSGYRVFVSSLCEALVLPLRKTRRDHRDVPQARRALAQITHEPALSPLAQPSVTLARSTPGY